MRGSNRLVNIRFPSGKIRRLPLKDAEPIVNDGRAKFISKMTLKNEIRKEIQRQAAEKAKQADKKEKEKDKKPHGRKEKRRRHSTR